MSDRTYLFAGGCARSGTTLLAKVLNCHEDVALGVERFRRHWRAETLTPELFAEERFFEASEADCARPDEMAKRIAPLRNKFGAARLVGDKFPDLSAHYDMLVQRFSPLRIVYVLRNPFSVAMSFQRRFEMADDPFKMNADKGLTQWGASVRRTLKAIADGAPITVVAYERAFRSDETAATLYRALGLDPARHDAGRLSHLLQEYTFNSTRERNNNEELAHRVAERASFAKYRELLAHCIFGQTAGALRKPLEAEA